MNESVLLGSKPLDMPLARVTYEKYVTQVPDVVSCGLDPSKTLSLI